jgi:hypothetical protein
VEHLRLAIAFMVMLSIVTFVLSCRTLKESSPEVLKAVAVSVLFLIAAYIRFVWGQLWIVTWIPLPSVIILSNWFPVLLPVLASASWLHTRNRPLWRRVPAQIALMGIAFWTVFSVLPLTEHDCSDEWIPATSLVPFRVCRQTTIHTCSAASAATMLEVLGIPATEKEMARLCLTRSGTTWLGMYHGLSIKLMGTEYHVRFFQGTIDQLVTVSRTHPVLLCCQLNEQVADEIPEYVTEDGWKPGVLHSVVCFGSRLGESFVIGDPSQPRVELWSRRDLQNLWSGTGLLLTAGDSEVPGPENGSVRPLNEQSLTAAVRPFRDEAAAVRQPSLPDRR